MATRKIVVLGNVQGVGFRWYVSRQAESLGVSGSVWNRDDGAVEMLISHTDQSRLATLENALWAGPGTVRSVDAQDVGEDDPDPGFRIAPTRNA